jgi:NAD(P)-dependent dehydrogenase (short-subunit alcohol dehydrogenase family)
VTSNDRFDVSGMVVVITGAAKGLGRAFSFGLADSHYCASKAALVSLTQSTAAEWAGASLLQRIADPDEAVGLIQFLLSDASAFITGADHEISGDRRTGRAGPSPS